MKYLILLIFISSLTSCLTVKRIEKNCDKFAKVCITETVKEIQYRDTTIYIDKLIPVKLPKDTVKVTDTLRIVNNQVNLNKIHKRFGTIAVDVSVTNSILNVNAYLIDSTILVRVKDTVYIEKAISEATTTNNITLPPVKYIPKFYKFTFWIFMAEMLGVLLWVVWQIKGGAITGILKRK